MDQNYDQMNYDDYAHHNDHHHGHYDHHHHHHPYPPYFIYKVVAGDTLWGLSQRYGTTVDAIKRLNGLYSDMIYVGQKLKIPR